MQNNIFKKNNKQIVLWLLGTLFLFVFWILFHSETFYGDAKIYWESSSIFASGGGFSFIRYNNLLRGYIFPFILFIQQGAELFPDNASVYSWAVTYSMLLSGLVVYQLPWLAKHLFRKEISNWKIIFLGILFCIFWQGNILYPLSDFYALFFLNFSVILFHKLNSNMEIAFAKRVAMAFLLGMCMYITYSIRTIYIFTCVFICLFFFFQGIKREMKIRVLLLIAALSGGILMSIPQVEINYVHAKKITPFVLGEIEGEKINEKQLFWGLYYSRYETYVGDPEIYPYAGVIFEDKVGKEIIDKEGIEKLSVREMIKMYFKYPLDIMGIYGRHLINAMDNRFPELYITDLYKDRSVYVIGNYLVWFLFFMFWITQERTVRTQIVTKVFERWQYIFLLICSSLILLAGAMEIRFFLPIYSLIYLYVVMHLSKKNNCIVGNDMEFVL